MIRSMLLMLYDIHIRVKVWGKIRTASAVVYGDCGNRSGHLIPHRFDMVIA